MVGGIILILVSPILLPISQMLHNSTCPQNSYGGCGLGSDIQAGALSVFLVAAAIIIGLILIIVGVVNYSRSRK